MTLENTSRTTETQFRALTIVAVCALGFLAYANTFQGEFVWDDVSSVLLHQRVQDASFSSFKQLFKEDQHAYAGGQGNFYRPLVAVSFMLDFYLSNADGAFDLDKASSYPSTFIFHFSNIAWHIAAAVLVFALLTRLGAPRAVRCLVPVIYVVHPLHTEAVAYISGRADSMTAVFTLASICLALPRQPGLARIAAIAASVLLFAAGLLSKESAAIYPALLFVCLVFIPWKSFETTVAAKVGRLSPVLLAVLLLAGYLYLRMGILNFGSDSTPPDSSFAQRLVEVAQAFALYVRLIFVPTGLHMERLLVDVPTWFAAVGFALILLSIALLFLSLKLKNYRAATGIAWFLVAWFPISGIFTLNAPMAEHWMYLPMVGFLWALAELLCPAREPGPLRRPVIPVAILACIWMSTLLSLTVVRNNAWHDNVSIYTETLRYNPDSVRVQFNLASTYSHLLGNTIAAKRHYEAVLKIYEAKKERSSESATLFWNEELDSHLTLGEIYRGQGDYQKAAEHFFVVASIVPDPDRPDNIRRIATANYGLGHSFLAVGRVPQAMDYFRKVPEGRPDLLAEIRSITANYPDQAPA